MKDGGRLELGRSGNGLCDWQIFGSSLFVWHQDAWSYAPENPPIRNE
jgi:hypothetical protein